MIVKNYLENREIEKDIRPLFESAFPIDERPPSDVYFSSFNEQNNKVLLGFYVENAFVGFTSLILNKDICYIFFLAVSPSLRNQGWGRQILSYVKEHYQTYNILLCYEEVDNNYKDYEMRLKRANFYKRNGFVDNPLKTNEFGVIFQTAYYGSHTVSFKDYQAIFKTGFGPFTLKHLKQVN